MTDLLRSITRLAVHAVPYRRGRRLEKNGTEAQRAKPLTPSRAVDALIGDEEQEGKNKKKGPFGRLQPAGIIR